MICNVIWLDENIKNEEKIFFKRELNTLGSYNFSPFINVDLAIEIMKHIQFQETKVIVSDNLYPEFVKKFKENINEMCFVPKIIIFARKNQNYKNLNDQSNTFYNYGGVAYSFQEVKNFLKDERNSVKIKIPDDVQLTFEPIDNKEKLILPLFFKGLIDFSNNNTANFTSEVYNEYSKDNKEINNLLGPIIFIPNIPIEILSKYYAKLYTADSRFHKDINRELGLNKVEKYLPFIKTLYEGVKLKSLPLTDSNILYRGAKIRIKEIEDIKEYIKTKKEDLPSSIVFSKSFLSFSKNRFIAEKFLNSQNNQNDDKNLSKVLFILEKDNNIEYNLTTHADIENISFFQEEREVLFFPFSSFEIKDINETNIGDEKRYEIKLLYLGKYLKDIEKDKNIIINENKIPDTKFKNKLIEAGLVKKEKVEKINKIILYSNYKQYEKDFNKAQPKITLKKPYSINDNRNFIIGEIDIKPDNINKSIRIINSFENFKKEIGIEDRQDDWKFENEKEIKENIEIKINGIIMPFSYYFKFPKEGKYIIQYSFKKNLSKTNHMFWGCNLLTNLDLSNFNTQNVTNMSHMFGGCNSLTSLNLLNFNTHNVTNMSRMFYCCYLLTNLNLSNFTTQNIINIDDMFDGCNSLTRMNIVIMDNKIFQEFINKKWLI